MQFKFFSTGSREIPSRASIMRVLPACEMPFFVLLAPVLLFAHFSDTIKWKMAGGTRRIAAQDGILRQRVGPRAPKALAGYFETLNTAAI